MSVARRVVAARSLRDFLRPAGGHRRAAAPAALCCSAVASAFSMGSKLASSYILGSTKYRINESYRAERAKRKQVSAALSDLFPCRTSDTQDSETRNMIVSSFYK